MTRYFCFILFSVFLFSAVQAQKRKKIPSEQPRLIVLFEISGMKADFLYRYDHLFGEGGFKRLLSEGANCSNACYDYSIVQSMPGLATLITGANPSEHGILSDEWYNRQNERVNLGTIEVKPPYFGLFPVTGHSNGFLQAGSFIDELCMYNNFRSKVISVSTSLPNSVLLSAHTGKTAYCLNPENGEWYNALSENKEETKWVLDFNSKKLGEIYLDRQWNPELPLEKYTGTLDKPAFYPKKSSFPHDLSLEFKKNKNYQLLLTTPFGNTLVKDFLIAAIASEELGKDEYCDILTVSFTIPSAIHLLYGLNSVELEDTYVRMDKEIAHFLSFIDETIEKQDVLFILTSSFGAGHSPSELTTAGIPSGYFDSSRAMTLVISYLNAVYGKANWIEHYSNLQVYLDRNLIEDSKLNLTDVQNLIARFLVQFTGVANAVTATSLENSHFSKGHLGKIQNSYHQKRSGDVLLVLEPGWLEINDPVNQLSSRFISSPHVPLVFYGWKTKRQTLNHEITMNSIAPTLCNFLKIPFPNSTQGKVIGEIIE